MSQKASQVIAEDLRTRIARGDLRAGEPLPVESELIEHLGVSKPVVREALRILETEGLIEIRRGIGGGPRVRHPSVSEAAKPMGVLLQIGDVLVMDVWTARDRIIAGAVERLARDHDTIDLQPLEAAVAAAEAHISDVDKYYVHLIETDEIVVKLAGNSTEAVLVAALRHIIGAELREATQMAVAFDVEVAVSAASEVASGWRDAIKHIRAGRHRAARAAYERQADRVRSGMAEITELTEGVTVVDVARRFL